jgi:hypothetical protein
LRYQALSARLADDRRALLEAQDRYDRGEVGLLPALEARQLLYATEEAEVASGLNRCLADISLYHALAYAEFPAVTGIHRTSISGQAFPNRIPGDSRRLPAHGIRSHAMP